MPDFVGASTGTVYTFSTATNTAPVPAAAQIGDVLLVSVSQERFDIPTLSGLPNLTVVRTNDSGQSSQVIAWKRLVAGDLGGSVTVTASGTTRRMMPVLAVWRDAGDPVFTHTSFVEQAGSDADAELPAVTPVSDGSVLVALMNAISNITPYLRSFTTTGWTERVDARTEHPSSVNAHTYVASRNVIGGAGVQQSGAVVHDDTGTRFAYFPTTVVLPAADSGAPVASAGSDVAGIEPWTTVTLTGTDDGGGGATRTWRVVEGPVSLTGSGATRTYTAPATITGQLLRFGYVVSEGGLASAESFVEHTVLPVTERVVIGGVEVPLRVLNVSSGTPAPPTAATYPATYPETY